MIERLGAFERKVTNRVPKEYEQADDIFVEEEKRKPFLSLFSGLLSPLHYSALGTKEGSPVRSAVRRIIALAMDQQLVSNKQAVADTTAYNKMPDSWKKDKGYKFAQLMDQWTPLQNENSELKPDTEVSYFETPATQPRQVFACRTCLSLSAMHCFTTDSVLKNSASTSSRKNVIFFGDIWAGLLLMYSRKKPQKLVKVGQRFIQS